MAEVRVFYDREGHTLTVWFTESSREYVCEETGDEVVLMKDSTGRVIGFEKLNNLDSGFRTVPRCFRNRAGVSAEFESSRPGRPSGKLGPDRAENRSRTAKSS